MINIRILRKFDGIGQEVELFDLKTEINPVANFAIDLFKNEKVIKLNIPHGELYHKCTNEEWDKIIQYIDEKIGLQEKQLARLKK